MLQSLRSAIHAARKVLPTFGRQYVTTADCVRLLEPFQVRRQVAPLPLKYAAILSPPIFGGRARMLTIADHVPRLAREVVQLHEAGHLYQHTALLGIAFDNDDWCSDAELGADAFAAIGLLPTWSVDGALSDHLWMRNIEDDLAAQLYRSAEGVWSEDRALVAACGRLLVRESIGI